MIVHRARSAQGPVSNDAASGQYSAHEPVGSARNTQRQLDIGLEQDQQSAAPEADDTMTDSQEAFAEADDQDGPGEDEDKYDTKTRWDKPAAITAKKYSPKIGDFKSKGSKGLQRISLSEHENLYITDKGERWYVAENPDGSTTKMQMEEVDGELQPAGEAKTYHSEGGKGKSEGDQGK